MREFTKSIIVLFASAAAFGGAQAAAEYRPDCCDVDHDHRSHNASYYDYYDADNYYRAGPYRGAASYKGQARRGHNDRRYNDRRYNSRDYDSYDYKPRSRVVNRRTYRTRYNARIVLVEEIYYTKSGREQLVCSVLAKGRDAYYVPRRQLKRIANRGCSRYARIQYL